MTLVEAEVHKFFQKGRSSFRNSRCEKGDMKQVPYSYRGPINFSRHRTKLSRRGDLQTGIGVRLG
jgi:hypothetical protein